MAMKLGCSSDILCGFFPLSSTMMSCPSFGKLRSPTMSAATSEHVGKMILPGHCFHLASSKDCLQLLASAFARRAASSPRVGLKAADGGLGVRLLLHGRRKRLMAAWWCGFFSMGSLFRWRFCSTSVFIDSDALTCKIKYFYEYLPLCSLFLITRMCCFFSMEDLGSGRWWLGCGFCKACGFFSTCGVRSGRWHLGRAVSSPQAASEAADGSLGVLFLLHGRPL